MKVLIAGGSGLIGQSVSDQLSKAGYEVWILSRNPRKNHRSERIHYVKWDGQSTSGWSNLIEEMDAIINLSGENLGSQRWTENRKQQILESRVRSSKAIINAIRSATNKPQVLIQASAVGYYGPSGDKILDEDSPAGNDFLSQLCVTWESISLPVEELGVRRVILRTGVVFSAHSAALEKVILPIQYFVGGPLGNGRQWWSWVHLNDVEHAIQFLLENQQARGPFNLTAPHPMQMKEIGREIARKLHRPFLFPVPDFALKIILGEMSHIVLDSQRAFPDKLQQLGYSFRFPILSEALDDIFS